MLPRTEAGAAERPAGPPERVLPGVWRWADPGGGDRCGTALATPDGLVLVDPPPLTAPGREALERAAGPVRHVVLTRADLSPLAEPLASRGAPRGAQPGDAGVTVWAPEAGAGVDRRFGVDGPLPGGLAVCALPDHAVTGAEAAFFWAGADLLITGDALPVVGQIPVYREGAAPPIEAFRDVIRALLAMEPGTLAPARQAPADPQVMRATGYAAYVGTPIHRRRAAPVEGPRLLVPQAERVLEEALAAPVVLRRAPGPDGEVWLADPFACARCARPHTPAVFTCGGPLIPRLCPDCRAERRRQLPALRIMSCAGGCCTRDGARAVLSALRQAVAEAGLADSVDVVPVSCLGECGLGPLVAVASAQGQEPAPARAFREAILPSVRRYAAEAGETVDEASERVLARFAALVQPADAERLVERLAPGAPGREAT